MNNIFPDFHTSISIQTEFMGENVNRLVFFSTPFMSIKFYYVGDIFCPFDKRNIFCKRLIR